MGQKLPHKQASEQYKLIKDLYNSKGHSFYSDVNFEIPNEADIYVENVQITLSDEPNLGYFKIGIHWEDQEVDKENETLLESVYSKLTSTNFQKIEQVGWSGLTIYNDNVTIHLDFT